ncbi:MAG: TetR/AcrR family transcriptional regulator [Clostridiales bacterium]|nr:TetR/AcrR family transcriptional regulator [Clostridiales bacterium]
MKKQPEITERTRQRFVDAFWSLVREKPISKIAVSELTRRAGYNRSTFYEYFVDTDDLLAYVENKLLEEIRQTILQNMTEHHSPCAVFEAIFAAMNEEIYLLVGPNGDSGFASRVRSELLPVIEAYLPIPRDVPHFDYLIRYVNSALFGLLQHWHEKGKDLSTEEMSAMMQELVVKGLSSRMTPSVMTTDTIKRT